MTHTGNRPEGGDGVSRWLWKMPQVTLMADRCHIRHVSQITDSTTLRVNLTYRRASLGGQVPVLTHPLSSITRAVGRGTRNVGWLRGRGRSISRANFLETKSPH